MTNDECHDVAVIGAGMAGLGAAVEAAGRGARVVLLDTRRETGGRARTQQRDGYALNKGAHALYVDGALEGAFPASAGSLSRTPLLKGDRLAMAKLLVRLPRMRSVDLADRSVDSLIRDLLGNGPAARLAQALFRLSTYSNDPAITSADLGIAQTADDVAQRGSLPRRGLAAHGR